MINRDVRKGRLVNEDTGDYLVFEEANRESYEWYARFYHAEGDVPYFVAVVIDDSTKEFDTPQGGATVVRWILKSAWIPSGRADVTPNYDVPDHLIQQLELFQRRNLETSNFECFTPRFEFIDDRNSEGVR